MIDKLKPPQHIARALSVSLLVISSVALIALQLRPVGWILLVISFVCLFLCDKKFAKNLGLINLSIGILGITEISTDISYRHMIETGVLLSLTVAIPYIVTKYIYKENYIGFTFGSVKKWSRKQYYYLAFTATVGYLLIPFYLTNSGAYINWPADSDTSSLVRLFIGTNGLGIWDELFFVIVVLGVLKQYIKFIWANIAQAIIWTAFLYELGFTGWGPYIVFLFALIQGYVYKRTHSLLYIVAIHLTVDLILFLALVNAHNPSYFNFFIT